MEDFRGAQDFIESKKDLLNTLIAKEENIDEAIVNERNECLFVIYNQNEKRQLAADMAIEIASYYLQNSPDQSVRIAEWLNKAACAYLYLYDDCQEPIFLKKCDTLFRYAEENWKLVANKEELTSYATFLRNWSVLFVKTEQYDRAEELVNLAIQIHEKQSSSEIERLKDISRLSEIYSRTGRIEEALEQQKLLYQLYEKQCDTLSMGQSLLSIADIYYYDLDDDVQGEQYALRAYRLFQKANLKHRSVVSATNILASIYDHIGLEEQALNKRYEALFLQQDLGIPILDLNFLRIQEGYVDLVGSAIGQNPESQQVSSIKRFCYEIIDRDPSSEDIDKITRRSAERVLAKTLMCQGAYEEAVIHYLRLLALIEEDLGKSSSGYLTALNGLSVCYLLQGEYEKSQEIALKLIELNPCQENYQNVIGNAIHLQDQEAVERYFPKLFEISMDYLRSQFLFLTSAQREELIGFGNIGINTFPLIAMKFPQSAVCASYAYNSALVSKGLLLNVSIDIGAEVMQREDVALRQLYRSIQQQRREIENAADSLDVVSLGLDLELKEKDLLSKLQDSSAFLNRMDICWRDVQRSLGVHDVAIEFVEILTSHTRDHRIISEDSYGALVLRRDWKAPRFVSLGSKASLDKLLNGILYAFNNGQTMTESQWGYVSKKIYEAVWTPLLPYIEEGDCVYFSPVSLLNMSPIEIVSDQKGQCINERNTLVRLSSTKQLCDRKLDVTDSSHFSYSSAVLYGGLTYDDGLTKETPSTPMLSGWNELPASGIEVREIAERLKEMGVKTKLYQGNVGTEETFKALSENPPSILHIATHGFYFKEEDANLPYLANNKNFRTGTRQGVSSLDRSGLILSGAQRGWLGYQDQDEEKEEDGILLSSEISKINLYGTDLVVLSACQTGLGDLTEDGVVGLQRAFKMAGVKTLLMTLWEVDDDATMVMMRTFYDQLLLGRSKRAAFTIAQKALQEQFRDPFYWGAFILLD